jgi:hypothetical protein
MTRSFLLLTALTATIFAAEPQLPQMSDKTEWLGYFVGWEEKDFDFGIGADGEVLMHPKKNGKRGAHKEFAMHYILQEELNGKWVTRQLLPEKGLESANEKGLDPTKPVTVNTTFTGDTKIEWVHVLTRGAMMIKPKLLEKTTENPIRVGLSVNLPRLYRFDKELEERELKKQVGGDTIEGIRLKDKKKVRIKFHENDKDITSEAYLQDGASAVEVKSEGFYGSTLVFAQSNEKAGRIDVETKGPLYNSFKMMWLANPEILGEKDCYISVGLE